MSLHKNTEVRLSKTEQKFAQSKAILLLYGLDTKLFACNIIVILVIDLISTLFKQFQ